MSNLNCLIGDIISGFVRTEFLLSHIFSDLGLTKSKLDFFADGKAERKLTMIKAKLADSKIPFREDYISLIDDLDELRIHRNNVVHSLILTNKDELMFHNYQLIAGRLINKTTLYKASDLEDIKTDLARIHNEFYELFFNKTQKDIDSH